MFSPILPAGKLRHGETLYLVQSRLGCLFPKHGWWRARELGRLFALSSRVFNKFFSPLSVLFPWLQ